MSGTCTEIEAMLQQEIVQGNDADWEITVTENDEVRDVSGDTFFFTVKQNHAQSDDDALIAKDSDAGITILDGPAGRVLIHIDAGDTPPALVGKYLVWDVKLKTPDGKFYTVLSGNLTILASVTQRTA
jgi:hypothetical protein